MNPPGATDPPEATSEEGSSPSSTTPVASSRKKLRKEEIIAEATRLFAERGYEGTSMGDLAERVGLRKASLFHHFESKDVLYATVLSQLLEQLQGAIASAVTAEGSFAERLDTLSDSLTGALGREPHAARLLIREAMDWGPVMRERLAANIQDVLTASVEFAKAGQGAGVFDPKLDPHQIILSLVGIYFIPFVIDRTVQSFVAKSVFEEPFIQERRRAVRDQIRSMVLVQKSP